MRPIVLLALLLAASPALADTATGTIPAGFAPSGSVWISNMKPVEGDALTLYTVVYNSSASGIEGAVSFYVDGSSVGSSSFTLTAGDTSVESVKWTATSGTHSISAKVASAIESDTKLPAALTTSATGTTTVNVSKKATDTASSRSSGGSAGTNAASSIIQKVASTSPIVGTIVNSAVQTTESIRQAGEDFLTQNGGVATSTATSSESNTGEVLGTSTSNVPVILGTPITKTGLLATVSRNVLPIFKYPALFYPIFFFILAFVFFFLAKKVGNPGKR